MATLTFADAPPELQPEVMQEFLKRLRSIYPAPIRFYGVGEYGDLRGRPHFHMALFGVSIFDRAYIEKAWSNKDGLIGGVHIAELNHLTAQYICGYVCKKLTKKDDVALKGKHPEFARYSLRPGIGALAIPTLVKALAPDGDLTMLHERGDVPETIRTGGKQYPLGRYLRSQLRKAIGWEPTQTEAAKKSWALSIAQLTTKDLEVREIRRENQYHSAHARIKLEKGKKVL